MEATWNSRLKKWSRSSVILPFDWEMVFEIVGHLWPSPSYLLLFWPTDMHSNTNLALVNKSESPLNFCRCFIFFLDVLLYWDCLSNAFFLKSVLHRFKIVEHIFIRIPDRIITKHESSWIIEENRTLLRIANVIHDSKVIWNMELERKWLESWFSNRNEYKSAMANTISSHLQDVLDNSRIVFPFYCMFATSLANAIKWLYWRKRMW